MDRVVHGVIWDKGKGKAQPRTGYEISEAE